MNKDELFGKISAAVVDLDEDEAIILCEQAIDDKIPAYETIQGGLVEGMNKVSDLYEEEEYFLPEVLMAADAMNSGLGVLQPHLDKSSVERTIKIVIGVVEGDTHDIGKNLVKILTESSGMEVFDLGRDVPLHRFVEKAEEVNADVIGMSTLMTTTMDGMKTVIDTLIEKNIREKYQIMIGGGPISQRFADSIGADIYTKDAAEAVRVLKNKFALA